MAKTSVFIDRDIAKKAAEILGTKTLRDTIDASLREVVNTQLRYEFITGTELPSDLDYKQAYSEHLVEEL